MAVRDPLADDVTYRVLDIHQHMPTPGADGKPELHTQRIDAGVALMDEWGVDWAVLQAPPGWPPTVTSSTINDLLVGYRERHPTRYLTAIGGVHSNGGSREIEELERIARELHLPGVTWHHKFQGTDIDNPWMSTALAACQDLGLTVLIHIWVESGPPEWPWRLAGLAERFPEVTFVAMDGLGSLVNQPWIYQIARRFPNIWFDTSMMPAIGSGVDHFIGAVSDDRLLYGSNSYSNWGRAYSYPAPILDITYAAASPESKAKILCDNTAALLNIELPAEGLDVVSFTP